MYNLGCDNSAVYHFKADGTRARVQGVYQRLTDEQVSLLENQLQQNTAVWGMEAMRVGISCGSCGSYVELGPTRVKGDTFAVVKTIGPFLGP